MKAEKMIDSMSYIDADLVQRAEQHAASAKRRMVPRRWMAAAACLAVTLIGSFGIAYATGAFDGLLSYFGGNTEPYMEEILSAVATASNDEMELRIDGAIADESSCHLVVSFVGLTDEMNTRFQAGDLAEQSYFGIDAVTRDGDIVQFPSTGSDTYTERDGDGPRTAVTQFADADMTYLVTCTVGENGEFTMSDLKTIRFTYEGLTVELDPSGIIDMERQLVAENPETATISDVYLSRLGFRFTMPVQENGVNAYELYLIKEDGTLWEDGAKELGWSATGYHSTDDTEVTWAGYWGGGSHVAVGFINLDDFCGVQINGENFYF
ncbi:MAG: DUF4179 domain-containing protein [Methanocorpusculum sp.]|nr:DUF4179 domain-containing protein [Methanocorpusculum sp.]